MIAKLGNVSASRDAVLTEDWANAACVGHADILENPDLEKEAKALCLGDRLQGIPPCPVLDECSRWVFGLRLKLDPGCVTAGMTFAERVTERRSAAGKRGKRTAA
jgi:hypothetical protein